MPLYLGIDLGTQSLKLLVLDPQSGPVASVSQAIACLPAAEPGQSEQDPGVWLQALGTAFEELRGTTRNVLERIAAIGVSGQQHGLVPLDAAGQVIRPAKLWNDVTCAPQCAEIIGALGGQQSYAAITGNHLTPGFTAGKVRWLHQREPENYERLESVLLPHDYLNYHLTGRIAGEAGDASGTGYFDIVRRRYAEQVVAVIAPDLRQRLPELVDAGEPLGTLRSELTAELGLAPETMVSTGGGDNMMAAIGAGAVRPGTVVISLGTSGTVFACAEQPVCDPAGEISAFCDSTGKWLPLGCTMNATVSTELTRAAFGMELEDLESEASAAAAGSDGVLCLPFFTGERSPDLPLGSAGYLGLSASNYSPKNLARAAMEGSSFCLARILDRLLELGVKADRVRLIGGGSNSAIWAQILAAACAHPLEVGGPADCAALGAAIHACWTHRRQDHPQYSMAACWDDLGLDAGMKTIPVNQQWRDLYRQRRRVFDDCVTALSPLYPAIRT